MACLDHSWEYYWIPTKSTLSYYRMQTTHDGWPPLNRKTRRVLQALAGRYTMYASLLSAITAGCLPTRDELLLLWSVIDGTAPYLRADGRDPITRYRHFVSPEQQQSGRPAKRPRRGRRGRRFASHDRSHSVAAQHSISGADG